MHRQLKFAAITASVLLACMFCAAFSAQASDAAKVAARIDALERHRLAGGGPQRRGLVSHGSFPLFLMFR